MPHTRLRRRIAALASAALVVLTLLPVTAAPVGAAGGSGFVNMANGHRNDNGRGPVGLHATIDAIAAERGRHLAEDEELGHDFDYLRRRFDEENICWRGFGEIVAYNGSGDFSAFGTQWMNSTTHRNIMLGDYTHAGGSREEVDGRWYGVMVFVKLCGASGSTPTTSGFTDLGSSTFVDDIEWLVENEITTGCAPNRFCPRAAVERGEMATFLHRVFDYPGTSEDFFSDDESSTHELAINRTREAEVTQRLRRVALLPARHGHPWPDGQLPGPGARPASGHRGPLRRRQRLDPRERHQPARRGRHRLRLHEQPLLPGPPRDPGADGRLPPARPRLTDSVAWHRRAVRAPERVRSRRKPVVAPNATNSERTPAPSALVASSDTGDEGATRRSEFVASAATARSTGVDRGRKRAAR